ncbi:hypothetical protein [Lysinibacter cavernae]|uniref:hypothetical protein n=1 Tax=Lysinibacter cavernae TaxID=1640652 RepID=UPI003620E1C3
MSNRTDDITKITAEARTTTGYRYRTTTAAKMAARGAFVPCSITAEVLFESLPEDGAVEVRWIGFGLVGGVERFSTNRMRRGVSEVEVLRTAHGTVDELQVLLVYPLGKGRTVRTFRHARNGEVQPASTPPRPNHTGLSNDNDARNCHPTPNFAPKREEQ